MFTDVQRQVLATQLRYVNSGCAFPYDVLPELEVIPCMMLQHIRTSLDRGLEKIRNEFQKLYENIDPQECEGCPHFCKICAGFGLNGRV
jgi:hypothetical protein